MSLSSLSFIFIFLPVFLLLYYLLPRGLWRNALLAAVSLIFFAWTDFDHLPILILSVLINYFLALLIGSQIENKKKNSTRPFMWLAVALNLSMLFLFKYTGFFLSIFNRITNLELVISNIALPLGISYFTFSGISYILDVYNGAEKPERNLIRFTAYLVMFPKLLQGPITRFSQVKAGLMDPRLEPDELLSGARRFIGGLAKKVLLADFLGIITDKVFGSDFTLLGADLAWIGLVAYTFQIYLDFSGYTDMAIGLGKMAGLNLPENFNFPYLSTSISDFWRRWHMTLTGWFRNYVFIPLEFARKREKILRQQSNLLIVFLLTGLWHGASWNFVLWGVYFGILMAIEASGLGRGLKKLPVLIQHVYGFLLIMLGWILFRITDVAEWGPFIMTLTGGNGWATDVTARTLGIQFYLPFILVGALFSFPLFHRLENWLIGRLPAGRLIMDVVYLGLFVLSISLILSNGFQAFIYAQF